MAVHLLGCPSWRDVLAGAAVMAAAGDSLSDSVGDGADTGWTDRSDGSCVAGRGGVGCCCGYGGIVVSCRGCALGSNEGRCTDGEKRSFEQHFLRAELKHQL